MASKVLVPAAPFAKLQVKKSPPDQGGGVSVSSGSGSGSGGGGGSGFVIGGDAASRIAHLEHSVRFLQEQHRAMLSGLHAEIEALRERNRDLQFQLIFNKESSPKASPPAEESAENNEETNLKKEIARLEKEAAAARGEARAAEARALQLQRIVDAQAEKLRELELKTSTEQSVEASDGSEETRAELRARLAEAEKLVRRLRGDADRQRREVLAATASTHSGGHTNLLFDGAHARHAHLQCMKNSLQASLRASGCGLDAGAGGGGGGYGYQNNYHFPPLHAPLHNPPEFWREPLREDYNLFNQRGGQARARRPATLPELAGHPLHRSTVYANIYAVDHTRPRANYEHKKKTQHQNGIDANNTHTPEDGPAVTGQQLDTGRSRPRRHHHRKHAPDHT